MKVARWFGTPFNAWYVGKIVQINKRRTKQDNVSAEFNDETYGTTWGHWPAASETYGADRKWVLQGHTHAPDAPAVGQRAGERRDKGTGRVAARGRREAADGGAPRALYGNCKTQM